MSKSKRSLCVSFSRIDAGLCIYYLFVWSNLNLLHNSLRITFPTQSCLVLFSFCANLLHSLIMWLMVSSQSPHNLHLLFFRLLSILTLIWLVLIALFCAALRRDSVSLLRFPFLSHVHAFSCEVSLVSRLKLPWSCFSSYFCFQVIVVLLVLMFSIPFLVTVITLPPRFCMNYYYYYYYYYLLNIVFLFLFLFFRVIFDYYFTPNLILISNRPVTVLVRTLKNVRQRN